MTTRRKNIVLFGSLITVGISLGLLFQNCSKGFQTQANLDSSNPSLTSTGLPPPAIVPLPPPLTGPEYMLSVSKTSPSQFTLDDLNFKLTGLAPAANPTIKWSHFFSGSEACMADVNHMDLTEYGLNCTVPGNLIVTASAEVEKGVVQSKTYTVNITANPNPPPPIGGGNVTFTIPAGTGNKSWNLATAPIELYIGMVLKIVNGDSVNHQMHIDRFNPVAALNGHPCAHQPEPMAPGGSYNCVVTKTYDPATDPIIWDHLSGTSARFYLRAYDGAVLYTQNCMGCHGPLATSAVKGTTLNLINRAFITFPAMSGNLGLSKLTPVQKAAIAFVLKN